MALVRAQKDARLRAEAVDVGARGRAGEDRVGDAEDLVLDVERDLLALARLDQLVTP